MEPEEDFETWRIIITTVVDDIVSFTAMLPGLKRLMESIEKTNFLPDNLSFYTDDFIEDIFPNVTNSILSTTSSKAEKEDNMSDFFRSSIKLCTSKIFDNSMTEITNEKEHIDNYKKQHTVSINMINIITKIFDKIDLNQAQNEKEKILDQSLIYYFLNDLHGIEKCFSAIDNIRLHVDNNSINNDASSNDSKNKSNDIADEILEKESLKLSNIFKLIQKVISATTIKEKINSDNNSDKIQTEKEKFEKYYSQMQSLINKIFPVFQNIASKNLRKFDVSHLDSIFKAIEKSYQIDIPISSQAEFPLILNLLEPPHLETLSIFLKSAFFDKNLYSLKTISELCSKSTSYYENNQEFFECDEEKRKNKKLLVFFINKDVLLNSVISNLEIIQSLHFNKEFGEELGKIYSFLIENKEGIITIDYIKKLWSSIQFVHSADRSSFYKIFENVVGSMSEKDNDEFIDFVLHHISTDFSEQLTVEKDSSILPIDKQILVFLISIIVDYKSKQYKNSFTKIRDLIWSLSFNENATQSKEATELKEISRRKFYYLCDYCSNELLEKLINEKLPTLISQEKAEDEKDSEREFILKLCANSITKQEEINNDLCNKIIQFCISQLPDKSAISILTNVCTTQKVSLEKEQIEQLSNISNKFLSNILLSSGFDDEYIENFFLTTKNVDYDLYDLIEKYIIDKNSEWKSIENDYLTRLPFEKEDILWTFSLKKSNVRQKFITKLCEIYSNNDGNLLSDKQMINHFLNKVNSFINDLENRESCFQLLERFINAVDETNPNLVDIKKHDQTKDIVTINFAGLEGKYVFSRNNSALVVFYQASKCMKIPMNQISFTYNNAEVSMNKNLSSIVFMKESVEFIPIITNSSSQKNVKHLRAVSPSTVISHSILMDKLISFLIEDIKSDTNNNSYVLMTLLSDLPTSAPISNMINYFYLMKEIDFKRLFPLNHPRFFLYCLNVIQKADDEMKNELIRTKGIEYFIDSLTRVDNLWLIIEIIDYLKSVLDSDELVDKYSNQLFEQLMRLASSLDASYQESCLSFMKKLKPTNIPPFDAQFKLQFVEPEKKEKKDDKDEEKRTPLCNSVTSSELSLYQESSDFITLSSYISYESIESVAIKSQESFSMKNDEKSLKIDNDIPLSHIITIVIAMTLIQKNVFINSSIEVKSGSPSAFLKKTSKETLELLPIPSEYFEASFPYLNSSNYKEFLDAFSPHVKPPTETLIQFLIDKLDVQSNQLPFIMEVLKMIIDEIKNEEKRKKIFNFIFENFFILDRNESIDDDVFENAMIIASYAPSEMIFDRIKEIGIPEFTKYRINGNDFKPDKTTTGLKNLGFTCYFNSILQQFFHCPLLRKTLIEYNGEDQLLKELGILFSKMRDGSLKFVSPEKVIENWICWDGEKLNPRIQQDAFEFTTMMIDKLASIIPNSMFNGKYLFKVEGINEEENNYYTERNEPFSIISLPINQSKTIEDCLAAFNAPSFFTNKNQYYADTLKRKIDAKEMDFVEELPDHLILQLKRFEYDYQVGTRKKIDTPISISKEIDVASICEFKNKDEKQITTYKLCGVIMHSGTAMGGHYYSFVMQRETNMWYKFNDSDVTPMTINEVLDCAKGYSANAYLLFYDRIDLVEIDDSRIDDKFAEQLKEENKMNSNYFFFMTNGFTQFLNRISKRSELQKLAAELVIKVLSHANVTTLPTYFEDLKERLLNDSDFASSIQNEVTDFKFTILNDFPSTSKLITQQVLIPMFSHSASLRLIQLAIDTYDFVIEKLPDSSHFFKVLYSILERAKLQRKEMDSESTNKLDRCFAIICEKTTSLLKDGIKTYASKQSKLNLTYVINSIDLSSIVHLFMLFDTWPPDFVEMLKDFDFLKNLYSSSNCTVISFVGNYIRAREQNLFDVNFMLKTFYEKESIHMNMGPLFKSVFLLFKEEAFPLIWSLKFKFNNNYRTPQDVALGLTILCKNGFESDFFMSHFSEWVPSLVLHESKETRAMANAPLRYLFKHSAFKKVFGDLPAVSGSMKYTAEFFNAVELKSEVTKVMKKNAFQLIQCLFGCFDKLKELIGKEKFNESSSFPVENYRAVQLLKLLKVAFKILNEKVEIDHDDQVLNVDFAPLLEFGKFVLDKGHSHPFDPHVVLILEILKSNASDEILAGSIPSDEIMKSHEKLATIPSTQFDQYMKILSKIVDQKLEKGLPFSNEFLTKLYELIIFNLRNLDSMVKISSPIESLNNIVESICTNGNNVYKSFIDYLDAHLEYCIAEGLFSCVTGLIKLKMKRQISPFILSSNFNHIFQNIGINYPSLYSEIIQISSSDDDILFADISNPVRCLCERGKENDEKYENYRLIIWKYLIENAKKSADESKFEQFDHNYNFSYIKLLNKATKKQKEIELATDFIYQFKPIKENDEVFVNDLIFLSRNSISSLEKIFDFLKEKVPERLKDGEFVSDSISNDIFLRNWNFAEKFVDFAFDGKTKEEISSIFVESRIVTNLIDKLNLLNFVYEKGIVENRFDFDDEEKLASLVSPIRIITKYKDQFQISSSEKNQLKNAGSLLIDKLKNLKVVFKEKDEVINEIEKIIS